MNSQDSVKVRVTRRFCVVPELVFDAWLEPELIGQWMFGQPGEEVVRVSVDPRVGGKFSFVVRRNGQEIDHVGEYFDIVRPYRLVFSWGTHEDLPESSRVLVDITRIQEGTEMTLIHKLHPKWAEFASRTEAAWTKMLGALAAAVGCTCDELEHPKDVFNYHDTKA